MAGTVESVPKMMLIGSTERSYKTSALYWMLVVSKLGAR
jgi:hypothetical protein